MRQQVISFFECLAINLYNEVICGQSTPGEKTILAAKKMMTMIVTMNIARETRTNGARPDEGCDEVDAFGVTPLRPSVAGLFSDVSHLSITHHDVQQ